MPSLFSETDFECCVTNSESRLNTCGDSKFISGVDMTLLNLSDLLPTISLKRSTYIEEEFVIEWHPQFGR